MVLSYTRTPHNLEGEFSSLVQQSLGAIPVVQANNRDETECGRFRRRAEEIRKALQRSVRAKLLFKLLVGMVTP
jgi:hypothetical protein